MAPESSTLVSHPLVECGCVQTPRAKDTPEDPMAKPTREDATLLIQVIQLGTSNGLSEATRWMYSDEFIPEYSEFVKKYPQHSEQYSRVAKVFGHFETIGTFVKQGLLSEDLVFDLLLVPWDRMKSFVLGQRDEMKNLRYGENFEWLGIRAKEWELTHPPLTLTAPADMAAQAKLPS
jgi:hypothetical protein